MAENRYIVTHPAWQDWLGAGLGAAVVLSPYFTADETSVPVQLATTFFGLAILLLALTERMQVLSGTQERAREWEGVLLSFFGAMMITLPFLLEYAGTGSLRFWHFGLGGLVFLLAMLELRRDYVADMKNHGWWKHA